MRSRAFVVGNAAWDETFRLASLPVGGSSVHMRRETEGPGGKGLNQAVVLARAGVPVTFVAAVGEDAHGRALENVLGREGLAHGLVRLSGVSTDWSAILLTEAEENAILTTRDAALALDPDQVRRELDAARPGDLCVLQGNLSFRTTETVIATARDRAMHVAFNPSPADAGFADLFAQVDTLFVNRDEAFALAGSDSSGDLAGLGVPQIVVTLGAAGARLISGAGVLDVPAIACAVRDPTAAGDTFLAVAMAASTDWVLDANALAAGARAASLTVARWGAFAALPGAAELAPIIAGR